MYHADDYATALAGLPGLLMEAQAAVDHSSSASVTEAQRHLAQAHQLAGTALIQLRSFDLAYQSFNVALNAPDASGDQVAGSSVVVTLCWLLLRQGRLAEAEQLAIATADSIEPRRRTATREQYATWGWLLLRAAAAAARDNRPVDADGLLDAVAAAAAALGDSTASVGEGVIAAPSDVFGTMGVPGSFRGRHVATSPAPANLIEALL
jgi:hypothetical protein